MTSGVFIKADKSLESHTCFHRMMRRMLGILVIAALCLSKAYAGVSDIILFLSYIILFEE